MGQLSRLIGFDAGQVQVMFSSSKLIFLNQFYQLVSSLGDDAGVESKAAPTRQNHGMASGH